MLKKIMTILLPSFIIFILITIFNVGKENTLRTNYEIEKITNIKNTTVYLLDKNDYFVEVDIFINNGNEKDTIRKIFEYLKEDNESLESGFKGYIPKDTTINDIQIVENVLYLDFSKEILDNETISLKGIIKTMLKQKDIEKVSIKVEGVSPKGYENELSDISINEENNFINRKDISKVVIYYIEKQNDDTYLVPVTKYINDEREKIEVIVEELKDEIPSSLISYINIKTELKSSKEENDALILDFNEFIKDDSNNYKQIAKSVFANYNVSSVIFEIDGKVDTIVSKTG